MPDDHTTSELGRAIQEVSDRATLLIREEIELAKAEMTEKVTKLLKGAVVGIVAGVFAVFALVYLVHSLSWGIFALVSDDINFVWVGYLIAGGILLLLGRPRRLPGGPLLQGRRAAHAADGDRGGQADQGDDRDLAARQADRCRRARRGLRTREAELMAAARTPEEIRRSIEANRNELGLAVERLRGEVAEVADWRKHLRNNQKQVMIGAAVAGFVLGGGIAAMTGLMTGRRRRNYY